LTAFLQGRTILNTLILRDYTVTTLGQYSQPWWKFPERKAAHVFPGRHTLCTTPNNNIEQFRNLHILDCNGPRELLKQVARVIVENGGIDTLEIESSFGLSLVDAYVTAVRYSRSKAFCVSTLALRSDSGFGPENWSLFRRILADPRCHLRSLTLEYLAERFDLIELASDLSSNSSVQRLSLHSSFKLGMWALGFFVSELAAATNLTSLSLYYPDLQYDNPGVIDIFEKNTTLYSVCINGSHTRIPAIPYYGLRNHVRALLFSQSNRTSSGALGRVLYTLLAYRENNKTDLGEIVFLSGIWYALLECPRLVSEIGNRLEQKSLSHTLPEENTNL